MISITVAHLEVPEDRTKVLNSLHGPNPFLTADPFSFGPEQRSLASSLKKGKHRQGFQARLTPTNELPD